jgi:hypothetical protein
MKTLRLALLSLLISGLLLAACSPAPQPVATQPAATAAGVQPAQGTPAAENPGAYPAPQAVAAGSAYPMPGYTEGNPSYPGPEGDPLPTGEPVEMVKFTLDKPIRPGATEITGSGPAGLPILLADVTMMGEVLSQTSIGADGKFAFNLSIPLEKNHRIGIALDELQGTKWNRGQFVDSGFYGEEAMMVPNVGFLYDTTMVEE